MHDHRIFSQRDALKLCKAWSSTLNGGPDMSNIDGIDELACVRLVQAHVARRANAAGVPSGHIGLLDAAVTRVMWWCFESSRGSLKAFGASRFIGV